MVNQSHKGFDFSNDVEDPHIIFDNVTYAYGPEDDPALHNVSLKIPRHKITAVIGASGSGKSSLIKALTGVSQSEREGRAHYSGDMYIRSSSINLDGNRIVPELGGDGNPINNLVNIKKLKSRSRPSLKGAGNVELVGEVCSIIQQKPELPPSSIEQIVAYGARVKDGDFAKANLGFIGREGLAMKMALAGRGNGSKTRKPWYSEGVDAAVARIFGKVARGSFEGKWVSYEADAKISYAVKGGLSKFFRFAGFTKPEKPDYKALRQQDKDDSYQRFLSKRAERMNADKARRENYTKEPLRIPEEKREAVVEALEAAHFMDDLRQQGKSLHDGAKKLSGGQQQRVFVAAALNVKAQILLADEATSSTDPISTGGINKTMNDIHKDTTVLYVCHDMAEVASLSHRVVVMHMGRVAIEGPTKDVFLHPEKYIRSDLPKTEDFSKDSLLWVFEQYIGRSKEHDEGAGFNYVFRNTEYDLPEGEAPDYSYIRN